MSGDGYQVRTADLTKHAQSIQQVAGTLGEAMAAAQQVTLGVQAYGLICGPLFVPPVLAIEAIGLETLSAAQQAANDLNTGITTTVRNYDRTEQSTTGSFTALTAAVEPE